MCLFQDLMYKDAKRWALTFQSYVQLTMLQQHSKKQVRPRAPSQYKDRLSQVWGIPMLKIRRSVRRHLYIETAPWSPRSLQHTDLTPHNPPQGFLFASAIGHSPTKYLYVRTQ